MTTPNILFFGDVHGHFRHVIAAVEQKKPDAIVLLGDIEAQVPLEIELAPVIGKTAIRWIHGNHDTDNDLVFRNLFESKLATANLGGRVVEIAGVRVAGLGGIFRGKIWMPPGPPAFDSYADWVKVNKPRHGEVGVRYETQARTHQSTIFWDAYSRLWDQKADVLVTHEAPSVHPYGFEAIDELAKAMGVQATFHGHHHDSLDYRAEWERIGFKAYGVGFCGITDLSGAIVMRGDFDAARSSKRMP